jgi:protein-S-isoprenylcysteine O-methyltransferase Ste14
METDMAGADNAGVIVRPPVLYVAALAAMLVLRWFWRLPIFGGVAFWPGLALVALAVGLLIWGRQTLVAGGTNVDPSLPSTAIVTSGPYRFSRNPLYVGLAVVYLGLALALDTWWGIVLLALVLIVMHQGVIQREERYLERKFGDGYRQYRAAVRRYL